MDSQSDNGDDDNVTTEEILRIVIVSTLFVLISLAMCIYIFNKFCKCYFIAKKNRNGEQRRWFFLGQKDTQTPQGMLIDTPVMNQQQNNNNSINNNGDLTSIMIEDGSGTNRIPSDAVVVRDPGMPIQSVYIDANIPIRDTTPLLKGSNQAAYALPHTRMQQYLLRQPSLKQMSYTRTTQSAASSTAAPNLLAPATNSTNQEKKS